MRLIENNATFKHIIPSCYILCGGNVTPLMVKRKYEVGNVKQAERRHHRSKPSRRPSHDGAGVEQI